MSNEFQIPAKPWGEAEIKLMKANVASLDDETRAELGLGPAPEVTPSEESIETVDTLEVETTTEPEVTEPETETTVETEEIVEGEDTVDKVDEDKA